MKKKWILMLCLVLFLAVTVMFYPGKYGNVSSVLRTVGKSDVYTEEEIEQAMDIAQAHFQEHFTGCTLLTLNYDADWWYPEENWAQTYEMDQAIIVTSSFYVPPKGADACFNPDSTCTGWQWVLVRNEGEAWTLKTWGYA